MTQVWVHLLLFCMMQMFKYLNYELNLLLQCCSEQYYLTEGVVVVVVIA
jgi:hypothetical protein